MQKAFDWMEAFPGKRKGEENSTYKGVSYKEDPKKTLGGLVSSE